MEVKIMKFSKSKMCVGITAIAILLVSLTITLLDVLIPLNFWIHPVLTFFFCAFLGLGVLSVTFGFVKRTSWFVFVGAILFSLSVFYAVFNLISLWWVGLIVALVILVVFAIVGFMAFGNKNEIVDNDSNNAEYKDYKQRRAEKLEAEKNAEPEELPEIKSFK
jgi:fatty acid desaturase